jgi:hypothetical protein
MKKKLLSLFVVCIVLIVIGSFDVLGAVTITNSPTDGSVVRNDFTITATTDRTNNKNLTITVAKGSQTVLTTTSIGNSSSLIVLLPNLDIGTFSITAYSNNGTVLPSNSIGFRVTGCTNQDYAIYSIIILACIIGIIYTSFTMLTEGINIKGIVSGLITLTLVVIIFGYAVVPLSLGFC